MNIKIEKLSKSFDKNQILKEIDIEMHANNCYALLGKNGAGKSTLINCLLDLVMPDSGIIEVNGMGYKTAALEIKKIIGVVTEENPLVEEFTGDEYLRFIANIYKLPKKIYEERITAITDFFFEDGKNVLKKRIAAYSTGMKKKIAFCASVLHSPDILILDEPFSGLDLVAAEQLMNFLKFFLKSSDKIIFISSHDLGYVNKIATHILVLDNAEIVFNGTSDEFLDNYDKHIDSALSKILKLEVKGIENIDWL